LIGAIAFKVPFPTVHRAGTPPRPKEHALVKLSNKLSERPISLERRFTFVKGLLIAELYSLTVDVNGQYVGALLLEPWSLISGSKELSGAVKDTTALKMLEISPTG
jgi:hypothetical protein